MKALMLGILTSLIITGTAFAATVATDAQINDVTATAEAGGNVNEAAKKHLKDITTDLIAQGMTGEKLQEKIAIATQELMSGIRPDKVNDMNTVVADIMSGAASGAVAGVKIAVNADPNLDRLVLISSVTNGMNDAAQQIANNNPALDIDTMGNALNQGLADAGAPPPIEPETFVPTEPDPPQEPLKDRTPQELPPTQDDRPASPL